MPSLREIYPTSTSALKESLYEIQNDAKKNSIPVQLPFQKDSFLKVEKEETAEKNQVEEENKNEISLKGFFQWILGNVYPEAASQNLNMDAANDPIAIKSKTSEKPILKTPGDIPLDAIQTSINEVRDSLHYIKSLQEDTDAALNFDLLLINLYKKLNELKEEEIQFETKNLEFLQKQKHELYSQQAEKVDENLHRKKVSEILGWISTGLAVASIPLIFTPAAGLLMPLGSLASAITAGHRAYLDHIFRQTEGDVTKIADTLYQLDQRKTEGSQQLTNIINNLMRYYLDLHKTLENHNKAAVFSIRS